MSDSVGMFVVPARSVSWDEHRSLGTMAMGHGRVTQVWEKIDGDWRITESDEDGRVREVQRLRIDDDGARLLGVWKGDTFQPWEPPLVWVPPYPQPGQAWTAEHRRPDGTTSSRSVEITASEHHPSVLTVVSDVRAGADDDPKRFRLIVRDHFAAGTGWIGYEALLVRPAGVMRTWSAAVERDGQRLPDAEDV
jgi:hypothetical protein